MNTGVYQIRDTINNKRYVGGTSNLSARKSNHWNGLIANSHCSKKMQHDWNRHGEKAFIFEILLVCSRADVGFYEQLVLTALRPEYNHHLKSVMAGCVLPIKVRKKMSRSRRGKKLSLAHCVKISKLHKGRKRSPETGVRITEAWKIRRLTPVSLKTRRRISVAGQGKRHTTTTKAKMAESRRLWWKRHRE